MEKFRINWTNDRFEDYANESEWIEAYPDDPCPGCGMPGTHKGVVCINCRAEGDL